MHNAAIFYGNNFKAQTKFLLISVDRTYSPTPMFNRNEKKSLTSSSVTARDQGRRRRVGVGSTRTDAGNLLQRLRFVTDTASCVTSVTFFVV